MKTAFLFPGQGAQRVGMGRDLCEAFPVAESLFDQAEESTSLPLKKLCFEGPEEELARTDIAQPAIFTVSAAVLAVMNELLNEQQLQAIQPAYAAGLSLGEYTALYAAQAMDFQTTVKLVARRGELMQQAAVGRPSGMVSILGLDEEKVRQLCQAASNGQILTLANFNCPGQIVISGQVDACQRAAELAKELGASGAVPLKVAGAFHSQVMAPAAEALGEALDGVEFRSPAIPVVANVDAQVYDGAATIKEKLLSQLVSPIRWQQGMEMLLASGVERFYEIGPGRVLAGLMRRIDRGKAVTCLNSRDAVEKLAE